MVAKINKIFFNVSQILSAFFTMILKASCFDVMKYNMYRSFNDLVQ